MPCPAVTHFRHEDNSMSFNVRCEHPEGHQGDHLAFYLGVDLKPREIRWKNQLT